ncbi:MAG: YraN family protein [Clostridia bacterium]|nr:YraN family protein [Clostridia bacterium]
MDKQASGKAGEQIACRALEKKGFRLVERNYRALHAEIDLIMRDGKTLVFVEVKARSSDRFGSGREAVTFRKQQNILRAAQAYLAEHGGFDDPLRFDVAEVDLVTGNVTHIENAFGM